MAVRATERVIGRLRAACARGRHALDDDYSECLTSTVRSVLWNRLHELKMAVGDTARDREAVRYLPDEREKIGRWLKQVQDLQQELEAALQLLGGGQ